MQLIIMAGGKGTRIRSVAEDIPKPMLPICGKPVLEHQINFFKNFGIKKITISIGHLGNIIKDYFGNGENFGVNINYIEEKEPLGTAGALRFVNRAEDFFLIVNGDIIFDFDLDKMIEYHKMKNAEVTLFTHPNQHPYDSAIIDIDDNGQVIKWINKEDERTNFPNRVNAGIHIVNREFLDFESDIWDKPKVDLDRDLFKTNISTKRIFAYNSPEYVKDMGTPERYFKVESDFKSGIIQAKNLRKKQRAIFLDRDGTINRYAGFINHAEQIELLEGVAEAIKLINGSPYLAIVVSNQPVIARGECTFEEMKKINNRLQMLLGFENVYVDDIVFCPHHPDKGFSGEIAELKYDCECRKPKPGMLLKMAKKYNIDLKNSYMIGDSIRDVQAGISASCQSIYIGNDAISDCRRAKNLLEAVHLIIN